MPDAPVPAPLPNQKPSQAPAGPTAPVPLAAAGGAKPAPRSRMSLFLGLLGLFLFLFLVFIVFLVVLFSQGGGNNQLISLFGLEPSLVQPLIQFIIGLVFGTVSFAALVVFMVGMFRRFTSAPAEVDKKRQSLIMAVISAIVFLILVFFWIVLYFYISQIQFTSRGASVISTDPLNTVGLIAPIEIKFSADQIEALYSQGVDKVVSYAWDLTNSGKFNDGTGRDIAYFYSDKGNNNGVFNVSVQVTLASGKVIDNAAKKVVTIANVLPKIIAYYSTKSSSAVLVKPEAPKAVLGAVPLDVSFDVSKSTDDGYISFFEWDFNGDGKVDYTDDKAVGKAKWTFTEGGHADVLVRATDNNGAVSELTIPLDFLAAPEKQAVIVVRPGAKGEVPYKVTLDGSASSIGTDTIKSYQWDFGDNSNTGDGRSVQHEYTSAGQFKVHLKVQGSGPDVYETDETIVVELPKVAPTAVFKVKDQTIVAGVLKGVAPLQLSFDASGSTDKFGKIVEYDWDFEGSGNKDAVGVNADHTFVEGKTYQVTLTVVDDRNLTGTATLTVDVKTPALVIDLQVNNSTGPVPLEVTFDASASRADEGKIISYTWDFGDKSPVIIGSARQDHIYNDVGEYTAKVTVLTDQDKRDSKSIIVVAREIELLADFTVNPAARKAGEKVFFSAEPSQGQISSYYWEFGDGTISRVVKPDHTYDKPGNYTVTLEIYDRKNRVSRKEVPLVVE